MINHHFEVRSVQFSLELFVLHVVFLVGGNLRIDLFTYVSAFQGRFETLYKHTLTLDVSQHTHLHASLFPACP